MSRRKKSRPAQQAASFLAPDSRKNLPTEARGLIANARNDITIPFFSNVLQAVDDTLINQGGGKGLALYDEIERDTHAFAMLQKRKTGLTSRAWEIEPGGDRPIDQDAADLVRGLLKKLPFDQICEKFLDATLKGYSVAEIVWARDGNQIVPVRIKDHDQRRFAFDHDWQPRLLTWTAMVEGIELPARKFIAHRFGVKANNPYGLGLGSRLFWAVLFKREGITFWLHFLEKFAGPTVVGKTPYGMLSDEQNRLLNTLVNAKTASAITVPIGTDISFLEASRSGSVTYEQWLAYWDRQISICVTGETLTTQVGDSGGNRALGEVHQEMLDLLVDSDSDLLSDTLRETLMRWIVEYNLPGAAVPYLWRVRAKNEKAEAETRKAKAVGAEALEKAIRNIVKGAASFEDDDVARDYIVSFDITDHLSDKTIDALVEARHSFAPAEPDPMVTQEPPSFAAARLKKSLTHRHVCFAEDGGPVDRITDQAVIAAAGHMARRIDAVRKVIVAADDIEAAQRGILELGARWTPDAFGTLIAQALELAGLEGREAALADDGVGFAEPDFTTREFREQIDFLRQKRGKPTRAWTDAMHGDHDRAFVVAGVTDLTMLEEFQAALIDAVPTRDIDAFAGEFDRLVEKYGWAYNGGRDWRIRTIFETNIRTSYMAGRLKQMRDPDRVRSFPFWQYIHAETRVPMSPRLQHVAWDGLVLRWDDPWWDIHFPPNDWKCSCGCRAITARQLAALGKTGPDVAPEIVRRPYMHEASGETVQQPEGIGYGWDYMPGDKWERGLVPSALIDEAGSLQPDGRHRVEIDTPSPLADLLSLSRPFAAQPLADDLSEEDYVKAFLEPFGADIGRAVLWEDPTGARVPVSEDLFRARDGSWKVGKRDRAMLTPLLAEALLDPDEIWLGVAAKANPIDPDHEELIVDRRYIRADPDTGLMIVFEMGRRDWEAVTAYNTTDKRGRPDLGLLNRRRGGKLLWRRK